MFLYETKPQITQESSTLEQEEVIIKNEPETIVTNNNNEHDYYNNTNTTSDNEVDVDEPNDCVQLDHTYCLPHVAEDANVKNNGDNTVLKEQQPHVMKLLKIMDGKTAVIFTNVDYNEYKINIPVEKFKCVLELLPFLFRRLPLVTNLADSVNYKCRYPYVAKTLNEYFSWNIGRRRSSEVSVIKLFIFIYLILQEVIS